MTNTLKLVLTDHWFEEIKSGRKTHEYRKATEEFLTKHKFLFKSKCNVNNLFEVQDD